MNVSNKISTLENTVSTFSSMKKVVESKMELWDAKANTSEVNSLQELLKDEMKKMKKEVEYTLEKQDELRNNFNNQNKPDKDGSIDKNVESRILERIGQMENKFAIFEHSRKD